MFHKHRLVKNPSYSHRGSILASATASVDYARQVRMAKDPIEADHKVQEDDPNVNHKIGTQGQLPFPIDPQQGQRDRHKPHRYSVP